MALSQGSKVAAFDSSLGSHSRSGDFISALENHFGAQSLQSFLMEYRGSRGEDTLTTPQFLEYLDQTLFKGDHAGWRELRVNDWFPRQRGTY